MSTPSRRWLLALSLLPLAVAACRRATMAPDAHELPAALHPRALACEHLVDPLGIGTRTPRLSWKLVARDPGARALTQSRYRVLVATSEAALTSEQVDLWDSGEVASDASVDIEYAGRALRSNERAFWRVRAWDQDGRASEWSPIARFSTGLLEAGDWQGEWIGFDAPGRKPETSGFGDAAWIGFAGDPPEAPAGKRLYTLHFELPAAATKARLRLTVDNQWRVLVNQREVHASDGQEFAWRRPADVDIASALVPGANTLDVHALNEAVGPTGLLARLELELADGTRRVLVSDDSWLATDGSKEGPTPPAKVLARHGDAPWGRLEDAALFLPPTRLLRTTFTSASLPVRATLFVSALGLVDVELNGVRVSEELFTPGWTDYTKRVPYRTHDVTALVRLGQNALGAELADGWYAGYVGYGGRRNHYGETLRLRAQLVLEHRDGTRTVVASDGSWRAATGARLEADFLMGERYDARLEPRGWSTPGFDDAGWQPVDLGAEVAPVLEPHAAQPVRVVAEFQPRETWQTGPDTFVCDLGQNLAGFVRLAVDTEAGRTLTVRHAERLNPDRTIYTTNLRGARATDVYTCRGGGLERWTPRFTFHGFQYVELTGLGRAPRPGELTALAVTSDTPYVSTLETSEPLLSRLMENIRWTQRMNFIDIPTDCPQRDERLGWTGDAQIYAHTATLNADVQAFFTKWLQDLSDAQRADGQLPMVAPLKVAGDDGGPAWADAGVIVPMVMYEAYGDRRLLERQYPSMQKFLAFCEQRSGEDCLPPDEFHCFGDWVSVNSNTPTVILYTAYFAHCAKLMERAATILGRAEDARHYAELFQRVKRAFNQAYVAADGKIHGDTQCAYALAIAFDLVDGPMRDEAARRLVADIEAHGGHFTTGFVGTKDLLVALSKVGREDVAYRLLLNRTYPSWLFSIEHGATSIWERWDGWTPEKGFQDPGMNSFAHYSFGSVAQWMFQNIGGLGAAEPGYARLALAPRPGGGLTHARTRHDSPRGPVEVAWELDGATLVLAVEVPPNVRADLRLPMRGAVREGGRALDEAPGVRLVASEADAVRVELGSGRYRFEGEAVLVPTF